MDKFIGTAGMVLIGWMVGTGCLWADQTPLDTLAQSAETIVVQPLAGQDASNSAGLDTPAGSKSSSKKIKKSKGSSKSSKTKKTKKKSTKKPKKSKSTKSKKKSKLAASI
jgi:hypothetical protein